MPCYELRLCSVEFTVSNQQHLLDGAKKAGYELVSEYNGITTFRVEGVNIRIANGRASAPAGSEHLIDKLKVAHSTEIVRVATKRFGWTLSKVGQNKYAAAKR